MNRRRRLGDLLVESNVITDRQLQQTLKDKKTDQKLGDALLQRGLITERQLIEVLEFQLGIPHVKLNSFPVDTTLLSLVSKEMARRNLMIPINKEEEKLTVAMSDPLDFYAIDDLRMATGMQIEQVIASKNDIIQAIIKYYGVGNLENTQESRVNMKEQENDDSIIDLVDKMLIQAIEQKASDIHIDPQESKINVRFRLDGLLRTVHMLQKDKQNSVISRIKIMANLDITENRVPQDGRIQIHLEKTRVDLRISTLPTLFGEKIVIRLLDLSRQHLHLSKLGLTYENEQDFIKLIEQPTGMVLITGPTGSGKTSTLYTALMRLNDETVNIITIEDPVEYQIEGINQIQVNNNVGLSFASGLRAILRQDPNIVMVGEIRDLETAEITVRASMTGHLVLSTVHTNDAASTITRLIDMGIEPYLVSSSLSGVVSQRLVRTICLDCKISYQPEPEEVKFFHNNGIELDQLYHGAGCESCHHSGFKGRIAIHEIITIDDEMKRLIVNNTPSHEIKQYAKERGTMTLLNDGLLKVEQGYTTVNEVLRVVMNH
jgi:type IV pilus assembly protein PilB